jgi:hypothetical protein
MKLPGHSLARRRRFSAQRRVERRSAQSLVYIMIVVVVLFFVILAIFDTHHIITQKIRARHGADAAALTGAKYQGLSLNMIGELNLMKVTTVIYSDVPPALTGRPTAQRIVDSLTGMQRRLAFVGPLLGMLQANEAAKLNGIRARPHLARELKRHADWIRRLADLGISPPWTDDGQLWVGGYPGWAYDYADMLDAIADAGVAVEFPNTRFMNGRIEFSNPLADQYLGSRAFYDAIAARDWCFLRDLLLNHNYTDYTFWGQMQVHLPPLEGSEYLNIGVSFRSNAWLSGPQGVGGGALSPEQIDELRAVLDAMANDRELDLNPNWNTWQTPRFPAFTPPPPVLFPQIRPIRLTWAIFNPDSWREFAADSDAPPPSQTLVSELRSEFNFSGADTSARVALEPNIISGWRPRSETLPPQRPPRMDWMHPSSSHGVEYEMRELTEMAKRETVSATAAAKPLGAINFNGQLLRPDSLRVVLPVFDTVRLIPLVYASGGTGFDGGAWNWHRFFHLPVYLTYGVDPLHFHFGCYYCEQLRKWEDADFRQQGIDWLSTHDCPPPPELPPGRPGGGGGGGQSPELRPGGVRIPH